MGSVFISYRRDDSRGFAGRLEDDLSEIFGEAAVFRDREIPAGVDFADHLEARLADADAVLVVIGPDWLDLRDAGGQRRLDCVDDWVRREIEFALAWDCLVVPVLVGGATMPWPEQLPDALDALAGRQAVSLSDQRWRSDVESLADQLALQSPALAADRARTGHARRSAEDARPVPPGHSRNGFGLALGRWAAGRAGKIVSTVFTVIALYILVRALGGPEANRMLDRVIDTTVEQARQVF